MEARKRKSTGWREIKSLAPSYSDARRRQSSATYISPWRDSFRKLDAERVSIYSPPRRSVYSLNEDSDFVRVTAQDYSAPVSVRALTILIMMLNVFILTVIVIVALS